MKKSYKKNLNKQLHWVPLNFKRYWLYFILLLFSIKAIPSYAQAGIDTIQILKYINPNEDPNGYSNALFFTNFNNEIFFVASNFPNGEELWKTDGTISGTELVKDIKPGPSPSNPRNLIVSNGVLFFTADDGANGSELWKTDGSTAGTVIVKDIFSGITGSAPAEFIEFNGSLFFNANDGVKGNELWKTDGTTSGTVLVKDINLGSGWSFPSYFESTSSHLFFQAFDGINGSELWKTDGTTTGTVLVKDINSGSGGSSPSGLINFNDTIYFTAYTPNAEGAELWKSDGTSAGTVLVKDIHPGNSSSYPQQFTINQNTLFFKAHDAINGEELWKTDGTTAGTVLVKDIYTGGSGSSIYNLIDFNGTLYFSARGDVGGEELWKSDGTLTGTVMVKDINPGNSNSIPHNFLTFNNELYFGANDGINGQELWKSDGTSSGTILVSDINPLISNSSPIPQIAFNGELIFTADNGIHGNELWKTDGTSAGTVLVKNIYEQTVSSPLWHCAEINGTYYFSADDGVNGMELWKSDGTELGTVMVKDINVGSASSSPQNFSNINGILYFAAEDSANGMELWKSDGTVAGTIMVSDINPTASSSPNYFTESNGTVFFTANDGVNGIELWKSDGTAAGTVLVKDIFVGLNTSSLSLLVDVNGTLFFRAIDGTNGLELWKSDGTTAGTVLVKDINPGTSHSFPNNLTEAYGTLFFQANEGLNGRELWKSDGTSSGTTLVKDITPGTGSSSPFNFRNLNGTTYFTANDGVNGFELWKTDGTSAGTIIVKDIIPGSVSSNPDNLTFFNNHIYFNANDGVNGTELWRSDGTDTGTVLIKDINVGGQYNSSSPNHFISFNDLVYFTANDGVNGIELWKTDGTTLGTEMVSDYVPGSYSFNPSKFTVVQDKLIFSGRSALDYSLQIFKYELLCAPTTSTDVQFHCDSYTWIDGNTYTSSNNTATYLDTNAAGCDSIITLDLTINSVEIVLDSLSNVTCNGDNDGSISITAFPSTSNFTYIWSNGEISSSVNNLFPTSYLITATDDYGCSADSTFIITEPNELTSTDVQNAVDSFTWIDGITYTSSNNTATFTDQNAQGCDSIITLDLSMSYNITFQVDMSDYTGSTPYDVYVSGTFNGWNGNANPMTEIGNSGVWEATVPVSIDSFEYKFQINGWSDQENFLGGETCTKTNGGFTNRFHIVTGSETLPEVCWNSCESCCINTFSTDVQTHCDTYTWIDGNTYTSSNNTATYIDTNAAGCDSIITLDLTINSVEFILDSLNNVSCNGLADGGATSLAFGGTPPYTYVWSNTSTTASISGVAAGTYNVTITDANGCTDNASVTITEPTAIVASAVVNSNVTCNGFANGDVTSSAFGGTLPYTYSWDNTATSASVAGLSGGTYNVTIIDANGCTDNASATITEPAALVASAVINSNITCNGFADGGAISSAVGGTPPYSYVWSNAATTAHITGVTAGTYTVTITDANGCTDNASVTITEPAALVASAVINSNVSCNGLADGGAISSVVGGTLPYYYGWNNADTTASISGVAAGTYTVTISDINGCYDNASVTITEPTAIVASAVVNSNVSCNGLADGGATSSAFGGTLPYTYVWSNGATTASISGVTAGTYNVTITDANGCTDNASVTITEPTAIVASAVVNSNVSCNGLADGGATSSAFGGTMPYTYLWSNAATTANISGVAAGTYTVTITDANGCTDNASVTITEPNLITAIDTQVACNSFTWIDGITYTSSNNTAMHTTPNMAGCDSVITLDLTILNATSGIDVQTHCDTYTWIDGITYSSSNNTATHTIPNMVGCDSVITLDLTILNSTSSTDIQTHCDSYTWLNGITYTASNNSATHTIPNSVGCDSVISLILTINTVDNSTSLNNSTASSNAIGSIAYQWVDCDNGNAIIMNETNQAFIPVVSGNYAVIVSNTFTNCTDTSSCISISITTGDSNGNGIIDGNEVAGDTNGNGVIDGNEIAGDANGNGVIDGSEITGDTNGNGIIDGTEVSGDTNGNGVIDGTEVAGDNDGNGIIEGTEIAGDNDGNGIVDGTEITGDTNGNGVIDSTEVSGDSNGNGIIDATEVAGDNDGNGIIDGTEVAGDTDGNGIVDGTEVAGDTNGNGIIDSNEDAGDVDGNGVIDGSEISGDNNGDGIIDGTEVTGDTNGNGIIDINEEAGDLNGNGVIDGTEVSGDNNGNGIIDGTEVTGDTNGNGIIDINEVSGDTNGNGIIDGTEIAGDNDGNGVIDVTEVSGDNNGNGIIDINEVAGDYDGNGIIDGNEVAGDYNGNGIIDGTEVAGDYDGNGIIEGTEVAGDNDGNGIIDGTEVAGDNDGNGVIDGTELAGDNDGNGVIDGTEIAGNNDGNGVVDGTEVAGDNNGNGIIDGTEVAGDNDGNGVIDGTEVAGDNDGNGVIDGTEVAGDTDGNNIIDENEVLGDVNGNGSIEEPELCGDANGNNIIDNNEIEFDCNGDGIADNVSINNIENNNFTIYPNPTNSILNIAFNKQLANENNIKILNTLGKIVYSKNNIEDIKLSIDVSSFASGVYYLKVTIDNKAFVKAFTVAK